MLDLKFLGTMQSSSNCDKVALDKEALFVFTRTFFYITTYFPGVYNDYDV